MPDTIERDLTVIGGGLAGVCGAIAAARGGLSVALVHNRPVLGGNSSSEIRMWTRGATGGGNLFAEEMGILGELKLENLYRNPEGNIHLWDELLFDFVLRETGITLFLNTHVAQVGMDAGARITWVSGQQLGSEREYRFVSPVFLDATGDATIGYLAGADYRQGREGRAEFGEEFAPEQPDDRTLGSTILLQTREAKGKVGFVPPAYAYSRTQVQGIIDRGGRIVNERMNGCDFWWLEYGGVLDTIGDNQEISLELKRIALGIWDYIKNSGKFEADRLTLEWLGSIPGKRESRRLVGDYLLTQNDVIGRGKFADTVCYGGWFLDFHPPEGVYSAEDHCRQIPVSVYGIPMRCLFSRNIENLLMAGRNISVTHAAFSSTRIMNTCALTGQAAGTIARHVVREAEPARRLLQDGHIEGIRQELIAEDMFIPSCRNETPDDLARKAGIGASSVRENENSTSAGVFSLTEDFSLVFPWPEGASALSLRMDSGEDTAISVELYQCEYPGGCRRGWRLAAQQVRIGRSAGDWVAMPLVPPEPGMYHLVIKREPGSSIHLAPYSSPGFIGFAGGGPPMNPCFKLESETDLYQIGNLTNGYNRPYILPNIWSSGPLTERGKETITLSWPEEIGFHEVRLFFNPDLSRELTNTRNENHAAHHGYVPRLGMPPELVKSYTIHVLAAGEWHQVAECRDNRRRLAVHRFPNEVKARKLRIEFTETYGSPYVEVFEVRVY